MGLQVFHFHTTGYEIDMKQKKVWKKYVFNKTKGMETFMSCSIQALQKLQTFRFLH